MAPVSYGGEDLAVNPKPWKRLYWITDPGFVAVRKSPPYGAGAVPVSPARVVVGWKSPRNVMPEKKVGMGNPLPPA